MKCLFCKHGETVQGSTVIPLTRKETTLVFKNVPADVCENCGEAYVSAKVSGELLQQANELAQGFAEVEVLKFAA